MLAASQRSLTLQIISRDAAFSSPSLWSHNPSVSLNSELFFKLIFLFLVIATCFRCYFFYFQDSLRFTPDWVNYSEWQLKLKLNVLNIKLLLCNSYFGLSSLLNSDFSGLAWFCAPLGRSKEPADELWGLFSSCRATLSEESLKTGHKKRMGVNIWFIFT